MNIYMLYTYNYVHRYELGISDGGPRVSIPHVASISSRLPPPIFKLANGGDGLWYIIAIGILKVC